MTIEEKAKAYDKALSKAREYHFQGQAPDKLAELESIFPQLRESENERIRKELIQFLTEIKNISESGRNSWAVRKEDAEMCNGFLAYLEKHKEQKPVDYDHEMWKNCEANFEGGKKEVIEHPEKYGLQKEQKPAVEQLDGTFNSYDMAKTFVEGQYYVIEHPERFGLCKPVEWSEDDKKLIDDVINSLCCYQNTLSDYQKEIVGEEIRKLKSLKPQPKQEWSKEDEKHINIIFRILDRQQCWDGATGKKCNPYQDEIDWLKSLRPQPHWKPSEEQMEALKDAFRKDGGNEYRKVINSLYCGLQKLL